MLSCYSRFEGISWNSDETFIAYVAEEPSPQKPKFCPSYKKGDSLDKDCDTWKGLGDWEEDWGETYAGKRQPALFIINTNWYDTSSLVYLLLQKEKCYLNVTLKFYYVAQWRGTNS